MCSALVITPNNVMYAAVQGDVGGVAPRIHYIAPVMNSHHCVLCDRLSNLSVVLVFNPGRLLLKRGCVLEPDLP